MSVYKGDKMKLKNFLEYVLIVIGLIAGAFLLFMIIKSII